MTSLPTLPHRTWLERGSLGLAGAVAAIGVMTAVAWLLGIGEVLQPFGERPALSFNAAIAFVFLGAALLGVQSGPRRFSLLAAPAAVLGALTLLQYLTGTSLGIDEWAVRDHLPNGKQHPGRPSLMAAIATLVGGAVLTWRAVPRAPRARRFIEAATGSVVAAAGVATLLGYGAGLPAVYRWGTATAASPVAALGLMCFGLALVSLAWRESTPGKAEAPTWAPMPAFIACCTITVILWVGLRDRELVNVRQKALAATDALATDIKFQLDQLTNDVERLALRRADTQDDAFSRWQADAHDQFERFRLLGCVVITFLDDSRHTKWHTPREGQEGAVNFDHGTVAERAAAIALAGRSPFRSVVSATTPVHVPEAGLAPGLVIYAPVVQGGELVGYVGAEFAYQRLFAGIVAARKRSEAGRTDGDYLTTVSVGTDVVYTSPGSLAAQQKGLTFEKSYVIADRRLRLTLTPTPATLAGDRTYLPEFALAAGLGIAGLLGLSVHLARTARAGQRAAELSNRKLFGENEERRRIEARLKVSDERLRLALDSTQIGIFEWSVAASHVYYSPGLWAMLGYEHTRMPSTVDAWQSLVHPEDLPLYRRRTESQLSGIASFIDPEYRVRARSGEWRWVYTRSKSVATSPDGRPTRIIGTVQDITARREAEIALRESQAEARKLSLVAAKTDNPVLIGRPDGRIEWANEAFCRVMEYSLEEVIGKNPAHFMLGPETSPRTVARIRGAMARGQGISTDVVNYAKSGRKYHLHLEVQPVYGANGELEHFIAVQTDITARVETEHQLRRAKAEADEASRAKSEFLASMSHEIRTPMNGVIGMTSLLMETKLTPEQRDYVNTIRTSGEALLTIINDILDFSKIESGKMELERAPFELALCIEDALDLFAPQASAKRLEIGYHVESDVPPWIIGDVTRLRQVLVNLVNNAVKFTPRGTISIDVRRVQREPLESGLGGSAVAPRGRMLLEFTVRDTGIGIPPERADRLFKAFSQVDSSTTRKYGGTGLGLAICQRLCELMGGTIRFESTPGEGSAFMFTVQTEPAPGVHEVMPAVPEPLREGGVLCVEDNPNTQARLRTIFAKWGVSCIIVPDAAAALAAAAELPRPPALLVVEAGESDAIAALEALASVKCPRLLLFAFGGTPPAAVDGGPVACTPKPIRTFALQHAVVGLFKPPGSAGHPRFKAEERPIGEEIPLEVLLAEDNAVNQKVALRFLERLGYRADAVGNGLEAVAALEHRRYDLVLMDLQMPEMDGFEATRQIRSRLPAERQPRIIALTANAMHSDREMCAAAGMDDHISKPVKMHEIAAAIRRHFGQPTESATAPEWIG